MKKIVSVVGARPQFIKCAAVSPEIRKEFNEVLVHTGQHYDFKMSDSFFNELNIPVPDYNLGVGSDRHAVQMAKIMLAFDQVIEKEKPDAVIVYGDTNSTAATAIVASKENIPVIHIEAGLREFNKHVPEEINKLLTDSIAELYFSPTETGVTNLRKEGKTKNVFNYGDVGIDLIKRYETQIKNNADILKKYNLKKGQYYFVTFHRAANTDNVTKLRNIVEVLSSLDLPVLFPIHPRTQKAIQQNNLEALLQKENIHLIDPIGFIDTQTFLSNAKMTLTDSGGIIKEAYFHKIPGIILDTQSEWVETIDEGWNYLAGPDKQKIMNRIKNYKTPKIHTNCLGDGTSSIKIVQQIKKYLYEQ